MANLLYPGTLTRISEGTKEGQTHVQEHWSTPPTTSNPEALHYVLVKYSTGKRLLALVGGLL